MKTTIIKRNLALDVQYTVIDKQYIPVLDGGGCTCDNCGKLIANIATVKSDKGTYRIGFDCLETLLINNNLLSGTDIQEYEKVKRMIPKAIRLSKHLKDIFSKNSITGVKFEKPSYDSDWITFYYLQNNSTESRNNDNMKLKDCDFDFIIATIKNIFPKITVLSN